MDIDTSGFVTQTLLRFIFVDYFDYTRILKMTWVKVQVLYETCRAPDFALPRHRNFGP